MALESSISTNLLIKKDRFKKLNVPLRLHFKKKTKLLDVQKTESNESMMMISFHPAANRLVACRRSGEIMPRRAVRAASHTQTHDNNGSGSSSAASLWVSPHILYQSKTA